MIDLDGECTRSWATLLRFMKQEVLKAMQHDMEQGLVT
jgi:hypothetical protein